MHVRRLATHVEVLTPAKINLFLEVLAKRPDGYHELETLLAAVTAYDSLVLVPTSESEIRLECRWGLGLTAREVASAQSSRTSAAHELLYAEIPRGSENLVWRAVMLLRERAGVSAGATIRLIKRIPAAAGLGGASSDAAAALVAASEAWQLHWSRERLAEIAGELGSDLPFFLSPGAAVCRGRGERIERASVPRLSVVVVRPPVGLSTPRVYKACRPSERPTGVGKLVETLKKGSAAGAAKQMHNDLEPAAASLTTWIGRLRSEFDRQGMYGHQMSGSGSSYFGLCRTPRHALRVAARLRARGLGAVMATTTAVAD